MSGWDRWGRTAGLSIGYSDTIPRNRRRTYDSLCASCEAMINDLGNEMELRIHILELEHVVRAAQYACFFCRLLLERLNFWLQGDIIAINASFPLYWYWTQNSFTNYLEICAVSEHMDLGDEQFINLIPSDYFSPCVGADISSGYRPELVGQLAQWIKRCDAQHATCRQSIPNSLPGRLLQLDETGAVPTLRLVATQNLYNRGDRPIRYLTLSHCWGRAHTPPKLLLGNLAQLTLGLETDSLPRTFKDAVEITRGLRISYLWIDSLCIVQDDPADVAKEVSSMHTVYRGSYLNLVADAAVDCSEGLLACKVLRDSRIVLDVFPRWRSDLGRAFRAVSANFRRGFESGTTANRAWCFQERLLSRRLAHFTREQVFWQCAELRACELCPTSMPRGAFGDEGVMTEALPSLTGQIGRELVDEDAIENSGDSSSIWHKFVRLYASTKLSFTDDRLKAMAGVIGQIVEDHPLLESRFVAGMWMHLLPKSLLWERGSLEDSLAPRKRSPTWSWVSLECPIIPVYMHKSLDLVARVVEVQRGMTTLSSLVSWDELPLVLEAPVARVHRDIDEDDSDFLSNDAEDGEWDFKLCSTASDDVRNVHVAWDWDSDEAGREGFYMALIAIGHHHLTRGHTAHGLVLADVRTSDGTKRYERIGTLLLEWKHHSRQALYKQLMSLSREELVII